MFTQTPRLKGKKTASTTSTPLVRSQRLPHSPAKSFLLQTNVISIQQQSLPSTLPTISKSDHSATMDPVSGTIALNYRDTIIVYNYRNPQLLFSTLKLDLKSIKGDPIISCLIPSLNQIGLVAINQEGLFRVWDNVVFKDQYQEFFIDIDSDPLFLVNLKNCGYFIGFDSGAVVRISMTRSRQLSSSYLARQATRSMFGLFTSPSPTHSILTGTKEKILKMVPGELDDTQRSRFLYILTNLNLQKWKVGFANSEVLLWEMSVLKFMEPHFPESQIIKVVDIDIATFSQLVFLVQTQEYLQSKSTFYSVTASVDDDLQLVCIKKIGCHASDLDVIPSLSVSNGGPVALVSFQDKLALLLLDPEVDFEEIVPLKRKELVVCSVDHSRLEDSVRESETIAAAYGTHIGPLEIRVSVSDLLKNAKPVSDAVVEDHRVDSFYSKLEQMVFFASVQESGNPIAFDIRQTSGDINGSCLELSYSILNGSNPHIPNLVDDTGVLNDCIHRLNEIIYVLNHNDLTENLDKDTRYQMLFNAEKLNAMAALWNHQNNIFNQEEGVEEFLKLLEYCANSFMSKFTNQTSLRQFFRKESARIGEFVLFIHNQLQATSNDERLIFEHGNLLTMVYRTAFDYRNMHQQDYNVDLDYTIEPWTATAEMISALQVQFEITVSTIEKLKKDIPIESSFFNDSGNMFSDPARLLHGFEQQMCELVHFLLASLIDRKAFLESTNSTDRRIQQNEENYRIILKNGVNSMIRFGLREEAFLLVESFKELDTLVHLTLDHSDPINKIKSYLNKFGEPFAQLLFQEYHTRGMLKELMDQDQYCSEYLDRFLKNNGYGYLSWIQDIKYGRYHNASLTLWDLSEKETGLKEQSLALAISKLAYLEAHSDIPADQVQEQLKSFDFQMDVVGAQKETLEYYKQILTEAGFTDFQSTNKAVDTLIDNFFAGLQEFRVKKVLLKKIIRTLWDGKRLKLEELLDLLTLQLGVEPFYGTVLEILLNCKMDLEHSLDYRIHMLWRAVWLSDDWKSIRSRSDTLSDDLLLEALKTTNTFKLYEWLYQHETKERITKFSFPPSTLDLHFPEHFELLYPGFTPDQIHEFKSELQRDQTKLTDLVRNSNLDQFYDQIVSLANYQDQDIEMLE